MHDYIKIKYDLVKFMYRVMKTAHLKKFLNFENQ